MRRVGDCMEKVHRMSGRVSSSSSVGRGTGLTPSVRNGVWGGVVVFTAVFLLFSRVHEAFPFLWPLKLTFTSCILLLALIIARKGVSSKSFSGLWRSKTFRYYIVFIVLSALSVPMSLYPGLSFSFFVELFLQINALFLLGLNVTINRESDFNFVFFSLLLSLFALNAVALVSPLYVGGRVTATYSYDPNDFALCLLMGVSLLYPLARVSSGKMRMICYFVALLSMCSIFLSQSRGAAIAFAAVALIESIMYDVKYFAKKIALYGVLFFVALVSVDASSLGRFSTIADVEEDYNMHSQGGRIAIWTRGIDMILQNPIFGVGIKVYRVADGASHEGGKWSEAHNSFIQAAAEVGIPGFLVFLLMLFSAFKLAKPVSPEDWLGRGIRLSLVGFVVGGFFLSWAFHFVLYFILGIAMIRERLIATSAYNPLLLFGSRKQKIVVNKSRVH